MTRACPPVRVSVALTATLLLASLAGCGSSDAATPPVSPTIDRPTSTRPVSPPSTTVRPVPTTTPRPPSNRATVTGRTTNANGRPLAGVLVQFYTLPRTYGSLVKATSRADGTYSANLPDGFYRVFATYYRSNEPGDAVDLVTAGGSASIEVEVPPARTINFSVP